MSEQGRYAVIERIHGELKALAEDGGSSFDPDEYHIEMTESAVSLMTNGKAVVMDHIQTAEGTFPVHMTGRNGVFRNEE